MESSWNVKNWTRTITRRHWLLAVVAFVAMGLPGCAGGEEIEVALGEWYIAAPRAPLKAGRVTISTHNNGVLVHEIEILKIDGTYQEFEVAELEDLEPGSTNTLVVELPPGSYEIVCTIVEKTPGGTVLNHYDLGMHTTLTVEE